IRDGHVTGVQTCALPISRSTTSLLLFLSPIKVRETRMACNKKGVGTVGARLSARALEAGVSAAQGEVDYRKKQLTRLEKLHDERSEERRVGKECRCRRCR